MKTLLLIIPVIFLFGCGVESLTAAATTAKLEAESAQQAKDKMEQLKLDLNQSLKATQDRLKEIPAEN